MSETKYFAIVTDLGTKEMMEAINEERKVNITHFAVGDGGGQYYTPDVEMTGLKNEVWRGDIDSCRISEESENVMIAETVIPAGVGGFTIREMAVFDDKNTMIAICNTPDTAKVRVTDGVVHELVVQMEILLNNKDSVELVTDPNIVTATKKDVELLGKDVELLGKEVEELKIQTVVFATEQETKEIIDDVLGRVGDDMTEYATDEEIQAIKDGLFNSD